MAVISKGFVTLLVLASLIHLDNACCENKCSGHGSCQTGTCTCTCHAQWDGADCSFRQCPSGLQWVGDASATDTIHSTMKVCSGAGKCDTGTGLCQCQDGFEGLACERIGCPSDCNGHGSCLSLRDAATVKDDRNFFREVTYTSSWEASKIYGCQCDVGWSGYDCNYRECPGGDDPLTTGQVDEIQVIECTCSATCTGDFYLSFRGKTTAPISFDADAATIKATLEALSTIHTVSVSFTGGTAACDADGVDTTITFTHDSGDVPTIRVAKNNLATTGATKTINVYHSGQTSTVGSVVTQTGTKEDAECNGRGTCNSGTGLCTCYSEFSSSDGTSAAAGTTGDCGYHSGSASTCPGATSCSGHGTCSGASDYVCTCYEGYRGKDCSQRECPKGKAWFAEPGESLPGFVSVSNAATTVTTTSDLTTYISRGDTIIINGYTLTVSTSTGDTFDASNLPLASAYSGSTVAYAEAYSRPERAHHLTECSNRGTCDTAMGTCSCQNGFTGAACERVSCPSSCSGRGICMSNEDLALHTESNGDATSFTYGQDPSNLATWDKDMLFGCKCDTSIYEGGPYDYSGHDCSVLSCMVGDDPSTTGVDEVQTITCSATAGTFTVSFRQQTTASINYDATAAEVKSALEALTSIGTVAVAYDSGVAACSSGGVEITVTFNTEHGDLPPMTTTTSLTGGSATAVVAEVTTGTKETAECSNHGNCDKATGACKCFAGYVSSDGQGSSGTRGDCSARDALFTGS